MGKHGILIAKQAKVFKIRREKVDAHGMTEERRDNHDRRRAKCELIPVRYGAVGVW